MSGLSAESEERQVCTLLYTLGEDTEDVLSSTNISRKKYAEVMAKFDGFFQVRKNVIYERARFNRRVQQADESVEQFITNLYQLAKYCEYGNLRNEMIHDRIVVGIRGSTLSEKLQLDPELTLEKAKKLVRQREVVHEHQQFLSGKSSEGTMVETVSKGNELKQWNRRSPGGLLHSSSRPPQQRRQQVCTHCGRGPHSYQACPAKEAACHRFNKKGHYSSMCHTKSVSNISEEADNTNPVETAYLDTLEGQKPTQNSWTCHIEVNGKATLFKIDTGAEVSAVTEQTFKSTAPSTQLRKPSKVLHGPNRQPLNTLGSATVSLAHKDKSTTQEVFVIPQLTHNLLGLPAITALELVTKVDAIQSGTSIIQEKFPSLFNGLGLMSDEYEIRLKPNAKPHALFTARHVPILLREKVQTELQRMQSLGVITKVDCPTP